MASQCSKQLCKRRPGEAIKGYTMYMGSLSKIKADKRPHIIVWSTNVNSWRPSDAYMRNFIGSSLVQIMACRRLGLSCYPTPLWHIGNKSLGTHFTESWIEIQQFPCKKMRDYMNTKISPARCRPSCLDLGVLNKDVYESLLGTTQPVATKL